MASATLGDSTVLEEWWQSYKRDNGISVELRRGIVVDRSCRSVLEGRRRESTSSLRFPGCCQSSPGCTVPARKSLFGRSRGEPRLPDPDRVKGLTTPNVKNRTLAISERTGQTGEMRVSRYQQRASESSDHVPGPP